VWTLVGTGDWPVRTGLFAVTVSTDGVPRPGMTRVFILSLFAFHRANELFAVCR
jgi:hypothetical protein